MTASLLARTDRAVLATANPPLVRRRLAGGAGTGTHSECGRKGVRQIDVQRELVTSRIAAVYRDLSPIFVQPRLAKSGEIPHKMWG